MTTAATALTAPVREDDRRSRPVWKPLAAAGIGGAVLIATGFGVFATLQATASGTAQQVTSGSLGLTLSDTGAGFTQSVSNLAPTDTVHRFVTLNNNGTLDAQRLTVRLATTGSTSLVTDGVAPATTRALRATITTCSVAWTAPTTAAPAGSCSGSEAVAVAGTPLSALKDVETTLVEGLRAAGVRTHLRMTLALPDQTEVVHNGATPAPNAAGTIQNQTAALTWTFTQTQRDGQVTGA